MWREGLRARASRQVRCSSVRHARHSLSFCRSRAATTGIAAPGQRASAAISSPPCSAPYTRSIARSCTGDSAAASGIFHAARSSGPGSAASAASSAVSASSALALVSMIMSISKRSSSHRNRLSSYWFLRIAADDPARARLCVREAPLSRRAGASTRAAAPRRAGRRGCKETGHAPRRHGRGGAATRATPSATQQLAGPPRPQERRRALAPVLGRKGGALERSNAPLKLKSSEPDVTETQSSLSTDRHSAVRALAGGFGNARGSSRYDGPQRSQPDRSSSLIGRDTNLSRAPATFSFATAGGRAGSRAHARVSRLWPDRVTIRVRERQPVARWGDAALVDVENHSFTPAPGELPEGLPRLSGPDGREADVVAAFRALEAALEGSRFKPVALAMDARGEWIATTVDGIALRFGAEDPVTRAPILLGPATRALAEHFEQVASIDLHYSNGFAVGWKNGVAPFGKPTRNPPVVPAAAPPVPEKEPPL